MSNRFRITVVAYKFIVHLIVLLTKLIEKWKKNMAIFEKCIVQEFRRKMASMSFFFNSGLSKHTAYNNPGR